MPRYEDKTDDELVILTRSSDPLAFDTLHRRYCQRVKAGCKRRLRSDEDAEDANNLTFVKAYVGIMKRQYNPPGNFKGWLGTIANHVCLDTIRRQRDEVPLDLLANVLPASGDDPASAGIVLDCMSIAFASLSDEDKLLMQLKYQQQMSYEEIAQAMGWSVAKARDQLNKARKRLVSAFRGECPDEVERLKQGRAQRGRPPKNRSADAGTAVSAPEESVTESEIDPAGDDIVRGGE